MFFLSEERRIEIDKLDAPVAYRRRISRQSPCRTLIASRYLYCRYILRYFGPPPPSGGTQSII
jgi:hypothetical protein